MAGEKPETHASSGGDTVAGLIAGGSIVETVNEMSADNLSEAVSEVAAKQQRMLSQSEVNEIVGRAKHDAVEGYKRKVAQQSDSQHLYAPNANPSASNAEAPRIHGMSESDYRRMASEEAQRLRDQWVSDAQSRAQEEEAKRIVNNFWQKIESGKSKYEDFDSVAGNIQLRNFPNVVQLLAEHVDNSGDVLYALGKNRTRLANLESLSERSPEDAIYEAKRLAQSIKDNESANQYKSARQPLSQMRPSNISTESGPLTAADYRRKYKG